MAIIRCPECGNAVSDKAANCIHCGYPLDPVQAQSVRTVAPPERSVAIVYGIQQTGQLGGTMELYIDGEYVATVEKGGSVEIPVYRDCVLTAKCGFGSCQGRKRLHAGKTTEVQIVYDRMWGMLML